MKDFNCSLINIIIIICFPISAVSTLRQDRLQPSALMVGAPKLVKIQ